VPYPLTFYVKSLPNNSAGISQGPIIRILESHKYDAGLHTHELEHVKQWFKTLSLHSFLYLLSDRYKLWAEVQAYKKQAACYKDDRKPKFARFIAMYYGLSITEKEVLELLNKD
jgi:hypothetical protein